MFLSLYLHKLVVDDTQAFNKNVKCYILINSM